MYRVVEHGPAAQGWTGLSLQWGSSGHLHKDQSGLYYEAPVCMYPQWPFCSWHPCCDREDTMGMDAQAGGTWANSSGLGWAISSMGLSRPAAQGSMSVSSVPTSAGVPVPSVNAPAAAASFASSAAIPQATPQRHDDGPLQQPGQSPCHLLSCFCISMYSGETLPCLANPRRGKAMFTSL